MHFNFCYCAFQVACPLPQCSNFGMTNEKTDSVCPRSHETVGDDVTLLYASACWSIQNLNVEEVDKQPEEHYIW